GGRPRCARRSTGASSSYRTISPSSSSPSSRTVCSPREESTAPARSRSRRRSPRSSPACPCRSPACASDPPGTVMRRRPLTARGWGCLLSGILIVVAANLVAARPLLYLGVLLIALPIVSLLIVTLPRRRGTVSRQISTDLLTVGETSRVSVRFELVGPGTPIGFWRDTLPAAVRGEATGEYPGDSWVLRYDVEGVRRGMSTLGPLMLHTVDPFGLAQREQQFGGTRTITVIPQTVALSPLPTRVGAAGGTARTRSSRIGQGADNLIPRPYASGDSRRRIHWRATAHRGDLMVRQEEEEASPDAMVVLDR